METGLIDIFGLVSHTILIGAAMVVCAAYGWMNIGSCYKPTPRNVFMAGLTTGMLVGFCLLFVIFALGCGADDGNRDYPEGTICLTVADNERHPCDTRVVDIDALEERRIAEEAECIALCCEDEATDYLWCGPTEWPDGGVQP